MDINSSLPKLKDAGNPDKNAMEISEIPILGENKSNIFKAYWPLIIALIAMVSTAALVIVYKASTVKKTPLSHEPLLFPSSDMPYLGHAEAPVIVIQVSDPLCSDCKTFAKNVEPELKSKYIDNGLIKFYHWPTFTSEDNFQANEALYCANDQGKYWQYRQYIANIPRESGDLLRVPSADYIQFAQSLSLKMNDFQSCFNSGKYAPWLKQKNQESQDALPANLKGYNVLVLANDRFTFSSQTSPADVTVIIDRALSDLNK